MSKAKRFTIKTIVIITISFVILLLLIPTASSEEVGPFTDKDWHIWRWYELIQINDDGTADVWVKIRFKFLNSTVTHYFYLELELPNNIKNFYIIPNKSTYEGSFLNYDLTNNNKLKIRLNKSVARIFQFYDIVFHYTTKCIVIKKRGEIWNSSNEWLMSLRVYVDSLLPDYIEYKNVNVIVILPRDASIRYIEPTFEYLSYSEFYNKTINFGRFKDVTYEGWDTGEVSKHPVPIKITVEAGQPIIKYAGNVSPGDIIIDYVTPNDLIGCLSFTAIVVGLIFGLPSSVYTFIQLLKAIYRWFKDNP